MRTLSFSQIDILYNNPDTTDCLPNLLIHHGFSKTTKVIVLQFGTIASSYGLRVH